MPFRRRRPRRRRRRRPRRRFRRRMRSRLDPEKKNHDFNLIDANMNPAGTSVHMNDIPQGITENDRIGRQALMLSIFLKFNCKLGAGATIPAAVRVWLLVVKQPAGIVPTIGDFLQTVALPTTSPRSLNQLGQFKVIWTKRMTLDIFNPIRQGVAFKRMRLKTRWIGLNGTAADTETGSVWLIWASDAGVNPPTITFSTRLRYTG